MENLSLIATLALASGGLSLFSLLLLHFTSPEFKPGWRMVSEYALGKHKWLLTTFFICWGVCAILCAGLLWNVVTSTGAAIGVALVFVSGAGAFMGGLFDVKHHLHGLSFGLGIPTLPIGALIVSYHLVKQESWAAHQSAVLWSAHAIWISLLLMAGSMMLIFSGFKKAGIAWEKDAEPPTTLPPGVIGVNGYANRLLVVCYIGWLMVMANTFLSI